jgi:DNA-binding CsgD family transcriptional regulator
MSRLSEVHARDVLALLDAAYDLYAEDEAWLQSVTSAAGGVLDDRLGLQAFRFDLAAGEARLGSPCLAGGTDEWREQWLGNWWRPVMLAMDAASVEALVRFGPTSVTSVLWPAVQASIPSFHEFVEALGQGGSGALVPAEQPTTADRLYYPDSWNVVGLDVDGHGVALVANRAARIDRVDPEEVGLSERVAAHLAAALRLRLRLGRTSTMAHAAAILEPTGRLVHAEGDARDDEVRSSLREAVSAIDRLRASEGDHRSADALRHWRALHSGRYSLVDEFESDGRRFVVALPNEPVPPSLRALSAREQQVVALVATGAANKVIAYELDIATSTVSELLRRAMAKLGVDSRAALVRRVLSQGEG